MRIVVMGAGYVGVAVAVGWAKLGHRVDCIERDGQRVRQLQAGRLPFHEDGLQTELQGQSQSGRLCFGDDIGACVSADIVVIAVGTPSCSDGQADVSQVLAVGRQVEAATRGRTNKPLLAIKSTVPPGTARLLAEHLPGFQVASVPEFLRQGHALQDFQAPARVVLGADDPESAATLKQLHAPFARRRIPLVVCDTTTAELSKYAANAMLAARVSLINECASLAAHAGADIRALERVLGLDPRIGPRFLHAGLGFGGSCLPKDAAALRSWGQKFDVPTPMLSAVLAVNRHQPERLVRILERHLAPRHNPTVALWGLTFKPHTDDLRDSPALALAACLRQRGYRVCAFDPRADRTHPALQEIQTRNNAYDAAKGADALILATEWPELCCPEAPRLASLMRQKIFVDGRGVADTSALAAAGFVVLGPSGAFKPGSAPRIVVTAGARQSVG